MHYYCQVLPWPDRSFIFCHSERHAAWSEYVLPHYGGTLLTAHTCAAEALLPARDDLPVVDVVRDAALERGHDRTHRPFDALPQFAAFRIRRGMRRQQHAVAELAQRGIDWQRFFLESVDGGAADAAFVDGLRQRLLVDDLAAGRVEHDGVGLHQCELLPA